MTRSDPTHQTLLTNTYFACLHPTGVIANSCTDGPAAPRLKLPSHASRFPPHTRPQTPPPPDTRGRRPSLVRLDRVAGDGDHLDAAFGELWRQLRGGAELRGAHGREVGRVREQDPPSETRRQLSTAGDSDGGSSGPLIRMGAIQTLLTSTSSCFSGADEIANGPAVPCKCEQTLCLPSSQRYTRRHQTRGP